MRKQLRSSIKEIVKGKEYLITIYLPYDEEKRFYPKKRMTFYGSKSEAESYQRTWIWELEHPEEKEEKPTETVGKWLDFWLDNDVPLLLKWEQNTTRRAKGIVEHNLKPHIGDELLVDLDADKILKMYKKLGTDGGRFDKPLSQRSIKYVHVILNQALKQAVIRKKIKDNPCEGLSPAGAKEKAREKWIVLDEEQLSKFLKDIKDDRDYAMIYTDAYTGLRQSEILGLIWEKILWDNLIIRVDQSLHKTYDEEEFEFRPRTKTESSTRDVDVSERVIAVLKAHREEQKTKGISIEPKALVFTDPEGNPVNANTLVSHYRKLAKDNGHKGMSFHHLRHTHATILLSKGEYVNEVAARLGHASPKTTYSIYGHVLPKNARRLSARFDEYVPE